MNKKEPPPRKKRTNKLPEQTSVRGRSWAFIGSEPCGSRASGKIFQTFKISSKLI